jgi:hypothetical protein
MANCSIFFSFSQLGAQFLSTLLECTSIKNGVKVTAHIAFLFAKHHDFVADCVLLHIRDHTAWLASSCCCSRLIDSQRLPRV